MRCELACDVAGRRCCSVEPTASQASTEHNRKGVGEREDGEDSREARPTGTGRTARPSYPAAAALVPPDDPPLPGLDAVVTDGAQTMSGDGRHAWRPSRRRCAGPN